MTALVDESTPLKTRDTNTVSYFHRPDKGMDWYESSPRILACSCISGFGASFSYTAFTAWAKLLPPFFGYTGSSGDTVGAFIAASPCVLMVLPVVLDPIFIRMIGWRWTVVGNLSLSLIGALLATLAVAASGARTLWVYAMGTLLIGAGNGGLYISRQLVVMTTSVSARNANFALMTIFQHAGIMCGLLLPALSTGGMNPDVVANVQQVVSPSASVALVSLVTLVVILPLLPDSIESVPVASAIVGNKKGSKTDLQSVASSKGVSLSDDERAARRRAIWTTLIMGFSRITIRSVVENLATVFYQVRLGWTVLQGSEILAGAYFVGLLFIFAYVHVGSKHLDDRKWSGVTICICLVATLLMYPYGFVTHSLLVVLFTLGLFLIIIGLSLNTAVTNSHATKYAMSDECLYTQDMIAILQIVLQTVLARMIGPSIGYAAARQWSLNAAIAMLIGILAVSGPLQLGMRTGKT